MLTWVPCLCPKPFHVVRSLQPFSTLNRKVAEAQAGMQVLALQIIKSGDGGTICAMCFSSIVLNVSLYS